MLASANRNYAIFGLSIIPLLIQTNPLRKLAIPNTKLDITETRKKQARNKILVISHSTSPNIHFPPSSTLVMKLVKAD